MRRCELQLLGGFGAVVDDARVRSGAWVTRRSRELVQLLALAPGRSLHQDEVLEALWPHLDAEAGRANLHKAASYGRRALGSTDAIVLQRGRVLLAPTAEVVVDVDVYERSAREALATRAREQCAAVALLFDDLLPDVRYEDWAMTRRESLRELQLQLLRAAELWEQVLALEPADEAAHRGLMRRYAEAGSRLAVRMQFDHLCELLSRDFQLEPSAETVSLYSSLSSTSSVASTPAPPPIRYVRTEDISIAYQVVGDGPVDLLMIPGWVTHLALDWEEPLWVSWCQRMTSIARLIRFDKRGTGLSDRPPGVATLEQRMHDARAVLDDVGVETAHVMGWSEGGPLAIALAVAHPERVRSLVLYGTQPRFVRDETYRWGKTAEEKHAEIEWAKSVWGSAGSGRYWAPSGDERFATQYEAYMRAGASPSAAAALLAATTRLDVRPLLPRIRVPTLVLARRGDPIGPPAPARAMSDAIPGARFVQLDGDDHLLWAGDAEALCAEIEAFISST